MDRDVYKKLKTWKQSSRRKPLIIKGARQVGKTYILKKFGNLEYENTAYFNFEEDPDLNDIFKRNLKPHKILENLSLYAGFKIQPGKHLILFDEIQFSNDALNSLKYFNEEANDYHIIAAGSLLGIRLSAPKSFPVGKVNFINMYPLTFLEFLDATGRNELRLLIENTTEINTYPAPFHNELLNLLRSYYFIGGMPEVVNHFAESNDYFEVRDIQKEIIDSYMLDFAKHAPTSDIPKLSIIWDSIPHQLGKENKKYIFAALKKSARAREYENALRWLHDAGLIYKVNMVNTIKIPLKGFEDDQNFKVYALDTGLLTAMAKIPPAIITDENQIFNDYKGAFVENYVLQQLNAVHETELHYWKSSGIAEVDFILEHAGKIFPLEAKSGINPYSKSLQVYMGKYNPAYVYRTTLLNLKRDGNIINIPLYAISLFPDKIERLISG